MIVLATFARAGALQLRLQSRGSNCLDVARLDADLQRMISAWGRLPEVIRRAILVLLGELNSSQSLPFLWSARRTPGTMLSLPVGQYPTHVCGLLDVNGSFVRIGGNFR